MKHYIALLLILFAFPSFAFETKAKQAILVDYDSGDVLYEKNADELMHPSSMSKLMTSYIVMKRLKEGSLKLTDEFVVSENAWKMQGSKMFVELGNKIKVGDLLNGVVVQSGNDACIVLAEGIAGTEAAFAELMNQTAKEIGLKHSHFVNATGWPDEEHLMTARDLSILAARIIRDFPEYYAHYQQKEFTYHGIKQGNRNLLLYKNIGVDGLKTGHTEVAGYGITVSGVGEGKRRLILVVNGLSSEKERAEQAELLFFHGLRDFERKKIFSDNQVVEQIPVWFGNKKTIGAKVENGLLLNLPKAEKDKIKLSVRYTSPLPAPIEEGDKIAEVTVDVPGRTPMVLPLIAAEDVTKLGVFARILPTLEQRLFNRHD